MKLLVCGSRSLTHVTPAQVWALIANVCRERGVAEPSLIIHGAAQGIDTAAHNAARDHDIPVKIYRPEYGRFGRNAPLIRNTDMVNEADAVLAIWDGLSGGTAFTVGLAKKAGVPTFEVVMT